MGTGSLPVPQGAAVLGLRAAGSLPFAAEVRKKIANADAEAVNPAGRMATS
jgi:hypothetical protein